MFCNRVRVRVRVRVWLRLSKSLAPYTLLRSEEFKTGGKNRVKNDSSISFFLGGLGGGGGGGVGGGGLGLPVKLNLGFGVGRDFGGRWGREPV